MSKPTTAVADSTVTVISADAVDAIVTACHDKHVNATETNDYDSNEETTVEPHILMNINYIILRTTRVMLLLLNTLRKLLQRYYISKSAIGHWLHGL